MYIENSEYYVVVVCLYSNEVDFYKNVKHLN